MELIIQILLELLLCLITSYLIFYKSWLKSTGNELAKLLTIEKFTFLKESVKKDFNESLESYKAKLSEELSLKIEPIKAELDKQNISHQIQYSFLHQERGKVLVELYKKLQELYSAMSDWTATMHPVLGDADKEMKDRNIRANNALIEFRNYFVLNKIFFSKKFCASVETLIELYWDKGWDFGFAQGRIIEGNLPKDYFKEFSTQLTTISKELKEKIPPMISEIEDLCRNILNVKEE